MHTFNGFTILAIIILCFFPILGQAEITASSGMEYWCKFLQDLEQECIELPTPPNKPPENSSTAEFTEYAIKIREWEDEIVSMLKPKVKVLFGAKLNPGYLQFMESDDLVHEGDEATYTVERFGGGGELTVDGELTVKYTLMDGSAQAGRDFEDISSTLTWNDGEDGAKSFTINIEDDDEVEEDETFTIELRYINEQEPIEGGIKTVTIISDDVEKLPGTIQFSKESYEVTENDTELNFIVQRLKGNDGQVSVNYFTSPDTAIVGDDFESIDGTLTWQDKKNDDKQLKINIKNDEKVENLETFTINLSDITGDAILGTSIVSVTIQDDDEKPLSEVIRFSQKEYNLLESDGEIAVIVERLEENNGEIEVKYRINNGTALVNQDFEFDNDINNKLIWQNGEYGKKEIRINIIDDNEVESYENFTIELLDINNLVLETKHITIEDNDEPSLGTVKFSQNNVYQVNESTKELNLTVERSEDNNGELSIKYTSNNGTAILESDFDINVETLTWQNGENDVKNIKIIIIDDNEIEESETFTISLLDKDTNSIIETVTTTIIDNDIASEPEDIPAPAQDKTCRYNPKFAIKPSQQEFILNIEDDAITQAFSGGEYPIKFIQPPNGNIITILDSSFLGNGNATIRFEPRAVGMTYFIVGDDCGYQATVNITVNDNDFIETCQSDSKISLTPEKADITMNIGDSRIIWFTGGQQKRWLSTPPAGEIVKLESIDFSEASKLIITAIQQGETQLGISDCTGESIVNIVVEEKSCEYFASEEQNITFLEGETFLLKTLVGDQAKLLQPPDDTIVTLELPISSTEDGFTQLKLIPRKFGYTKIVLGNCGGETVINLDVLKPDTLEYACHIFESDLCENIAQLIEYQGVGINKKGETIATSAYFLGKVNIIPESKNYVITQTDKITTKFMLMVDEKHIGLPADILTVVERQSNGKLPEFFMHDGTIWKSWLASDLSSLIAIESSNNIPAIVEISPNLQILDDTQGKYTLYIGYRLENGTIIFNGKTQPQFWRANSKNSLSTNETRAYFTGDKDKITIKPDFNHLGNPHDIIIVALHNKLGYMQSPSKKWYDWDGKIASLIDAYNGKILKNNMEVKIFTEQLDVSSGKVDIYIGYRLKDNSIVFNGIGPIIIEIP